MAIPKPTSSPRSVVHKIIDVPEDADKIPMANLTNKRVSIAEGSNVVHCNTQWTKSETLERWYTKSDYKILKQHYKELRQQITQREEAMMDRCASSYANVVLRLFRACTQLAHYDVSPPLSQVLSEADQHVLYQRMAQSHGRVGLDCTPRLSDERVWQRRQAILQILAGPSEPSQHRSYASERFAHYLASALEVSLARY
jgi:hypothetical protein